MSREWVPQVVNKTEPVPVEKAPPAEVAPPQIVVMPPDPAPRPKRWVFTPLRDDQNLIVEVIAEPVY